MSFGEKKIKKQNKKKDLCKNKKLPKIDYINVNKILLSKKEPSFKNFLKHIGNNDIRPLCIWLLQITGFTKYFKDSKVTSFRIIDKNLLKDYTKIWEKTSSLLNEEFDNEPVYDNSDKCIKIKI